jgi:hypothetical protein
MQRRFVFIRDDDQTGISGTGKVVEGVRYSDHRCAYRWMTEHQTDQIADTPDKLDIIHGHQGRTRIVYLDDEAGNPIPEAVDEVRRLEAANPTPWRPT